MTGEEASGPPGPKVLRLLCFAGAGLLITVGTNLWLEMEKKSAQKQQRPENVLVSESSANAAVPKVMK